MAKKIGFKPSTPNINKGLKTHGSFPNAGQKPGKKAPVAKEKTTNMSANDYMHKVVSDLRKQGKRRINMMPDTGAFH